MFVHVKIINILFRDQWAIHWCRRRIWYTLFVYSIVSAFSCHGLEVFSCYNSRERQNYLNRVYRCKKLYWYCRCSDGLLIQIAKCKINNCWRNLYWILRLLSDKKCKKNIHIRTEINIFVLCKTVLRIFNFSQVFLFVRSLFLKC